MSNVNLDRLIATWRVTTFEPMPPEVRDECPWVRVQSLGALALSLHHDLRDSQGRRLLAPPPTHWANGWNMSMHTLAGDMARGGGSLRRQFPHESQAELAQLAGRPSGPLDLIGLAQSVVVVGLPDARQFPMEPSPHLWGHICNEPVPLTALDPHSQQFIGDFFGIQITE
ncbi:MAG TPA: hypothetical protein VLI54_00250 [Bacillota bacterium]|nr:hypothetical protein [Bacillota bacterium]